MKIVIVDDHPIVVKAFIEFLNEKGYTACEGNTNYNDLISILRRLNFPENNHSPVDIILLLDIQLGKWTSGETGITWTKRLLEIYPDLKIILITGHSYPALLEEAKDSGARAFLLKTAEETEIIDTIQKVANGENCILSEYIRSQSAKEILSKLQSSHRRILQLMAEGKRGEEIAALTNYSLRSVRNRIKEIHLIFHSRSNTKIISKAIALGIVKTDWSSK